MSELVAQGASIQGDIADAIVVIDAEDWTLESVDPAWIMALEAGKVLYFPRLAFRLKESEYRFLKPEMNAQGSRSITLEASGRFKGSTGDEATQAEVAAMVGRFR